MPLRSSGQRNADAQITAQKGGICGGMTLYAAAADCSVKLYDVAAAASAAASNMIAEIHIDVSLEGSTSTKNWEPVEPIKYTNGLYADVTGAGATYIVYYKA